MILSESILDNYAKKILGFAYEKTGNSYDAEDLAQEIMVQLITHINGETQVEHLSSFIYTVCCYTWSKYLRKNKKHWNYEDLEEAKDVADDISVELEAENKLLYGKLRKAVSTLAKTQREIILMHYYENKTTAEIARLLDMNDNTVRWYLGDIRKSLKEKIDMKDNNLNIRPLSLCIGIDGWTRGQETFWYDLLAQNIMLVCYGEPLTISEISEKLNVAAAYLENPIERMVYMDFLKQIGKKYQTNFFIKTDKVLETEVLYGYENAQPYADRIYDAVMGKKEELMSIDYFNKADVNQDYFLWQIILMVSQQLLYEAAEHQWKKYNITKRPVRKDGSEFWIIASIRYETLNGLNDEQTKYARNRHCSGYKINNDDFGELYQMDTFFLLLCDMSYRNVTNDNILIKFTNIISVIRDKIYKSDSPTVDSLSDYEKVLMTEFVNDGYISIKDGLPHINIPVLTKEQMQVLNDIIEQIKDYLGRDFFKDYLEGFSERMDRLIPAFLHKDIRNYHKYASMGGFDAFAHLIKEAMEGGRCRLAVPDKEDAKHALTMLVLNN